MKIPGNIPLYIFLIFIAFFGFLLSIFVKQSISLEIFTIFVAAGGFLLSSYILYVKHCDKPMVCPTGSSCETVIYSEYSKFFGIPLEYLGMLYYGLLVGVYTLLVISPSSVPPLLLFGVLYITAAAFLFSVYLTSIQAFVLRQWCMWCLLSAVFSTTIFIVSIGKLSAGIAFLSRIYPGLLAAHLFAFAIGVGGTTVAAVLFFRFLKDFRVSGEETNVLKTISEAIWAALAIIILTEFMIYIPMASTLGTSAQFLAKIFAIIVVTITGVIINLIILPRLIAVPFEGKKNKALADFIQLRRITFGVGAIAISSWYFAFALDVLPELSLSFSALMTAYVLILAVSVLIGRGVEYQISKGSPVPEQKAPQH